MLYGVDNVRCLDSEYIMFGSNGDENNSHCSLLLWF